MAVAENGVASSENHFETTDLERSNGNHINSNNDKSDKSCVKSQSFPKNDVVVAVEDAEEKKTTDDVKDEFPKKRISKINDDDYDNLNHNHVNLANSGSDNGGTDDDDVVNDDQNTKNNVDDMKKEEEGFKKEIRELNEMLSKLNPKAKEFVPTSLANPNKIANNNNIINNNINSLGYVNTFVVQPNSGGNANGFPGRRRRNGFGQGKRRMNTRTSMAQREEVIRRTVYVSDIDQQVTEEQLAGLFINCGQVVDCRICGDPNSMLRFAFVEFTDEESAKAALSLSCTQLGYYPVRVLPSKTAIAPVNPTFLPKSENEREMCARTVYCTNIDKKVTQQDIQLFFQTYCGEVQRLRLLGDYHHSTRIAFVEFAMAESAIMALNCSGFVLGSLPIRVSPSKTPVRPRTPRSPVH